MSQPSLSVTVQAPPATARFSVGTPRIEVTLPVDWMVKGFERALDRLRDAAAAPDHITARDVSIALFEVCSWLDSLNDRFPQLKGSPHIRALLFVRNRTHHNFASALYSDPQTAEWSWYGPEVFPIPKNPNHLNPRGQRAYERVAARRSLSYVLAGIERAVRKLS